MGGTVKKEALTIKKPWIFGLCFNFGTVENTWFVAEYNEQGYYKTRELFTGRDCATKAKLACDEHNRLEGLSSLAAERREKVE